MTGRRATAVQFFGMLVAAAGFYELAGLAWTMLALGVTLVFLGTAAEMVGPRQTQQQGSD